jgi:hypothetical protein
LDAPASHVEVALRVIRSGCHQDAGAVIFQKQIIGEGRRADALARRLRGDGFIPGRLIIRRIIQRIHVVEILDQHCVWRGQGRFLNKPGSQLGIMQGCTPILH